MQIRTQIAAVMVGLTCVVGAGCAGDMTGDTTGKPQAPAAGNEKPNQPKTKSQPGDAEARQKQQYQNMMTAGEQSIDRYWRGVLPKTYDVNYTSPNIVGGYNAATSALICKGQPAAAKDNAFYCETGQYIAWDRSFLYRLYKNVSPLAPVFVIAHEWGHAIQDQLDRQGGLSYETKGTIGKELTADCLAGAWAGNAVKTGQLTRDELNDAVQTLFLLKDPNGTPVADPQAHGTGLERIDKFSRGVDGGPTACITP